MSNEGTPLSDLLEETAEQPEAEAPEAEAPEPQAEQPRGPDGKFLSKQTGDDEAPEPVEAAPPADKLPQEEYKAIREEREKRQAAEARLTALEQQLQQLQQPKEPPAPPPSMWEDEAGWQQHFGQQVAQQAAMNAKLDMSEMLARQSNPDFEEMKGRFVEMAQANPAIVQQALSDPHPWAKAYAIAKNAARMDELGATNLDELKAKMREELMAEMAQGNSHVQQVPPTLTTERSVGARTVPWGGPKSLDELLA